jgi:hypothetical protein
VPEPMTRRTKMQNTSGRADVLLPIQVRYYKRMRRGHTYPVQVSWTNSERGVAAKPVKLRLEVAGAIVVPAEQTLRPVDPEDAITFFVTPLGRGKLRHHVLEVHYDNAKIFELPLRARVSSQRLTIFLLVMTFLAPWLLTNYCKTPIERDNLGPKDSLIALIKDCLPDLTEVNEALPAWLPLKDWVDAGTQHIGTGYAKLCDWCNQYPIASYTALGFFGLTLISAYWHKPKRRWRTSEPIELPAA